MALKLEKNVQIHIWYFIIVFFTILGLQIIGNTQPKVENISYSQFEKKMSEGRISKVYIDGNLIYGDYIDDDSNGPRKFVTASLEPSLVQLLLRYNVDFSGVAHSEFLANLISWIAPAFFFLIIWYYGFQHLVGKGGPGGFLTVGQNKSKIYIHKDIGVTFDDVAGVDDAKKELKEIIDFLKNPDDYQKLGAHIPKGVLLVGPPGTGKTLLAKAVAGEAKVPFFSISGSEFIELFVGVGAARVRDLFEQAREHAPAIIFIDELDALGRARGAFSYGGGHDEREQTLNQLLAEMDGFDTRQGLVILAATNRPEILDSALLRAGRFDRQVLVDRPDQIGRVQILRVHSKKIKLSSDVDLTQVAALTTGFSGADLANLVNEAAIFATRRNGQFVTLADFTLAIERIIAGLEKRSRILTSFERRVVAYHEMGHALVSLALPGSDTVHKVSIVPRGIGSLGYTISRPTEDRYLMTKSELENKISILLGGRASEMVFLGHISTGASDDLVKATDIAHSMVTRYGMDDDLGCVSYEVHNSTMLPKQEIEFFPRKYSETTAKKIDDSVFRIIHASFLHSKKILEDNREVLEACVEELLKTETLEGDKLRALTSSLKKSVL